MAFVEVFRKWPDGDMLRIRVDCEESYPDAVAEAKVNALNAYRDALGMTLTDVEASDE